MLPAFGHPRTETKVLGWVIGHPDYGHPGDPGEESIRLRKAAESGVWVATSTPAVTCLRHKRCLTAHGRASPPAAQCVVGLNRWWPGDVIVNFSTEAQSPCRADARMR